MRNHIANLYNAASAPIGVRQDALAERQNRVREEFSLFYEKLMGNIGYGKQRLKDTVEKRLREEEIKNERRRNHQSQTSYQRVNGVLVEGDAVYKGNHDAMGKVDED